MLRKEKKLIKGKEAAEIWSCDSPVDRQQIPCSSKPWPLEPIILWRVVCLNCQSLDKLEGHACVKESEYEVWTPVDTSVDTPVHIAIVSQDGNLIHDQRHANVFIPLQVLSDFVYVFSIRFPRQPEHLSLSLLKKSNLTAECSTIMCSGDVAVLVSRNTLFGTLGKE